jgi:anti-sigma factor RsiW
MTCQDVRRQLGLWATGDVPPAGGRRVEAHLASCPACREAAEAYRAAVEQVRGSASPTPVRAGTVARLRSAGATALREERRRTRRRRVVRLAAGLAATVLLGVAVGYVVNALRDPATEAGPATERWRTAFSS